MNENQIGLRPELIIGLIGPVGTDLNFVAERICELLKQYKYESKIIQLSDFIKNCKKAGWKNLQNLTEDKRIDAYMTRGNELRRITKRNDILALLTISKIQNLRKICTGDKNKPCERTAFILKSLKHPDELSTLKEIYADNFITISVYSPRKNRRDQLALKIATSYGKRKKEDFFAIAEKLITRDEFEEYHYGQNVRNTFPLADFFIDATTRSNIDNSLLNILDLLFGSPFITPKKNEFAMMCAYVSALLSSSSARQVGAAIMDENGQILALGTNEVPKCGGGFYYVNDDKDFRDFKYKDYDISDELKKNILKEIIDKMKELGWLRTKISKKSTDNIISDAIIIGNPPPMRRCQFMDILEYGRSVHAEMSALCSAAYRGISVKDCYLFTTTFPCHECARHIIATGIKKVFFIEPYPKSLVSYLYEDSISIEEPTDTEHVNFLPYEGVAPRMYIKLFSADKKRDKDFGCIPKWDREEASPILLDRVHYNVISRETNLMIELEGILAKYKIKIK